MSIGTTFERSAKIAIGKFQRGVKSATLEAAREERDRFARFFRANRLGGPTTPPWPAKGDFSKSGRVSRRTGRLMRSLKAKGIKGTNETEGGALSVNLSVEYGRGVVYAAVHEFGRPRASGRHTPARTGFRVEARKFVDSARLRLRAVVARVSAKVYK